MTFAHASCIQMIPNLASDQFRCRGQRIERERHGKSLQQLQRTVHAPEHHAVETAAV